MMKVYLGILLALTSVGAFAQGVKFDWARAAGGTSYESAADVATDKSGNVYTLGSFGGTVDFNPGSGTYNLTSIGSSDIFIQKLDSKGNFVWAKAIPGVGYVRGNALSIGPLGDVYVTGYFQGEVDFDPGSSTYNLSALYKFKQVFILKLGSSGSFKWARQVGSSHDDRGVDIVVDNLDYVYVAGRYLGTVDFNPGSPVYRIKAKGAIDAFILKLNAAGVFIWAKSFGGTSSDVTKSIALDGSNNIYTTGEFSGTVDFDPGSGTSNITSTKGASFIQKLNSNGGFIWVKSIDGTDEPVIAIDASGNGLITGYFENTVDFDPGAGTFNMSSLYGASFIEKLNSSGGFVWAKKVEAGIISIATDAKGGVYTTGAFIDTVDFDPGSSAFKLVSKGNSDIFIQKLTSSGTFEWAKSMGGYFDDAGESITISKAGDVHVVGSFQSGVDFDPGSNSYVLVSKGNTDVFVQKLGQCGASGSTDKISACGSYKWIDGITYTKNNYTATKKLTSPSGCDSLITLNLTINKATYGAHILSACESYRWINGVTYTSSNQTAKHTIKNKAGCDSIISLKLTINKATSGIATVSSCDSYKWVNGVTYTSDNNTAKFILKNVVGCDSVITLNLTINTVDVGILSHDPKLIANAAGASYNWLNCDNNFSIVSGETKQSFTPSTNGSYAVRVTEKGCTDTSKCLSVTRVGFSENSAFKNVRIFPNPNTGQVNVGLNGFENTSIKVLSVSGQLIYFQENINDKTLKFDLKGAPGIYFLEVNIEGKKQVFKLIKQ